VSRRLPTKILQALSILLFLYLFLLSINLLGHSFKLFGREFAEALIVATSNPFAGLLIGIVTTSLIQSSSTTTSITVGLVAAGGLSLEHAIPIIMGANIGTTITNTLVSLGHIGRRVEFRRAFAASVVHDFFNICAVIVLFPLELAFGLIQKSATQLESFIAGKGGLTLLNPLKAIISPVVDWISELLSFLPVEHIFLLILALVLLFTSLTYMIHIIRSILLKQIELVINRYLFRNDLLGFLFGIVLTATVQSSSVTTSLIVPLAGAGLVTTRKIFPYTLGANIGTTITAILAALATVNHVAITVALAHLCFNIFGILIFYPLKFIPIQLAEFVGKVASASTKNLILFIITYILLHFIPILLIFLT
jgi:sodium-dependent phosphate cotransporter